MGAHRRRTDEEVIEAGYGPDEADAELAASLAEDVAEGRIPDPHARPSAEAE